MTEIRCYAHGIFPPSEALVAATRDAARGRRPAEDVQEQRRADAMALAALQREAGLDYVSSGMLAWPDLFRPLVAACPQWTTGPLRRWFDNNTFIPLPVAGGAAGLDVVYDGEQQRSEMYAWAVKHAGGFEPRGTVRSFDDKYYSKAAATGPVSLKAPYHDKEYKLLQAAAVRPVKVPVTGPYTLAVWSFDERYGGAANLAEPLPERRFRRRTARRELVMDIARHLVRPNIEALLRLGATWIQIDEPGGSTEPDEIALMAEAYNACVEGLDAVFSMHLCFSDYRLFFPGIEQMTGCAQYAVGFANDDSRELGTSDDTRPGYRIIRRFRDLPTAPALGLGVLDIHTDFVEPPELVRDRILYATEVFGAPQRLQVIPAADCAPAPGTSPTASSPEWSLAFA